MAKNVQKHRRPGVKRGGRLYWGWRLYWRIYGIHVQKDFAVAWAFLPSNWTNTCNTEKGDLHLVTLNRPEKTSKENKCNIGRDKVNLQLVFNARKQTLNKPPRVIPWIFDKNHRTRPSWLFRIVSTKQLQGMDFILHTKQMISECMTRTGTVFSTERVFEWNNPREPTRILPSLAVWDFSLVNAAEYGRFPVTHFIYTIKSYSQTSIAKS